MVVSRVTGGGVAGRRLLVPSVLVDLHVRFVLHEVFCNTVEKRLVAMSRMAPGQVPAANQAAAMYYKLMRSGAVDDLVRLITDKLTQFSQVCVCVRVCVRVRERVCVCVCRLSSAVSRGEGSKMVGEFHQALCAARPTDSLATPLPLRSMIAGISLCAVQLLKDPIKSSIILPPAVFGSVAVDSVGLQEESGFVDEVIDDAEVMINRITADLAAE